MTHNNSLKNMHSGQEDKPIPPIQQVLHICLHLLMRKNCNQMSRLLKILTKKKDYQRRYTHHIPQLECPVDKLYRRPHSLLDLENKPLPPETEDPATVLYLLLLSSVPIVPLPTHRQWSVASLASFPPTPVQIRLLRTSLENKKRVLYLTPTEKERCKRHFTRGNAEVQRFLL